MSNTVEILKAARDLIADERRWTKFAIARDKDGTEVGPDSDEAVCFCAIGAVRRIAGADVSAADSARAALLRQIRGTRFVGMFNDNHTHNDVLALFDRAIARAEGGAA